MDQILTLWIDSDIKTAARVAAARQGISMSQWIRDAIEQRVERDDPFFDNDAENIRVVQKKLRAINPRMPPGAP